VQPAAVLRQALGQPAQPATAGIGAAHAVVGHLNTQESRLGNGAEPDPGRPRVLQRVRDSFRCGEPSRGGDIVGNVAVETNVSLGPR
jgi:hypothetical protein